MSESDGFQVGIEFDSVLAAISKQIYETPLAFIRENVQNAIDALRMQASRQGIPSSDPSLSVRIIAREDVCEITDNGIGMSLDDLRNLFWTIGASGKRTEEARAAGCVGMFGIGGFANFGVCDELRVVSQAAGETLGHWTELSRSDIEGAGGAIPRVSHDVSSEAAPRGTVVRGRLKEAADTEALLTFVQDFVQYAEEHVFFNDEPVSRRPFRLPSESTKDLAAITAPGAHWSQAGVELRAYAGRALVSLAVCAFLKAIRPLASWSSARWFSSFFDQRIRIPRLRFSQEWLASTTQRLARQPGVRIFSAISSPRARMCAVNL
jgi:hypothetical protein